MLPIDTSTKKKSHVSHAIGQTRLDTQLLVLAVVAFFVVVLGTIGFFLYDPEPGWLTAAYRALQLFLLESGDIEEPSTPILIEAARWLAMGVLLGAAFTGAHRLIAFVRFSRRLARLRGHIVVCGLGRRGVQIANSYLKKNHDVVAIEADENNPHVNELAMQGVNVLIGNGLDDTVRAKAGVRHCKSLFAVTGDDDTNLLLCEEIESRDLCSCGLVAAIESQAWRGFFMDRLKPDSRIQLMAYSTKAARMLMLEVAKKAASSLELRQRGCTVLIESDTRFGLELLQAGMILLQVSAEHKPRFIMTEATEAQRLRFEDRCPEYKLVADIEWHQGSADSWFRRSVVDQSDRDPIDLAIFSMAEDDQCLERADRMAIRSGVRDDHIFAVLQEHSTLRDMSVRGVSPRQIHVTCVYDQHGTEADVIEEEIEEVARQVHARYIAAEKKKHPDYASRPGSLPEDWAKLPERYREANRLPALHHAVKRAAWNSRVDEKDPLFAEDRMLEHLARSEHMRWMAEKVVDGWRYSPVRDNDRLLHDQLKPFDTLERDMQEKDYETFRWAL